MSSILSLEELEDAKILFITFGINKNDKNAYNLQIAICETAIEYHRQLQEVKKEFEDLYDSTNLSE
jgi:hypothetical protein